MWYIFHVDLANRLQMPVWKGEGPSKPSQTNNLEGDWTNIFPTFWFSSHQISSKPACGERGTVPFSAGVVTWCESGCSCVHLIKLLPKKVSSRVKKQKHLFHRTKPFSLLLSKWGNVIHFSKMQHPCNPLIPSFRLLFLPRSQLKPYGIYWLFPKECWLVPSFSDWLETNQVGVFQDVNIWNLNLQQLS